MYSKRVEKDIGLKCSHFQYLKGKEGDACNQTARELHTLNDEALSGAMVQGYARVTWGDMGQVRS